MDMYMYICIKYSMENLFINFHWETLYKANIKCSLHAQITMGLL